MNKPIMLLLTAPLLTSCAAITDLWQGTGKSQGSTTLAPAVDKLSAGDSAGAAKVLKKASEGKPVAGVTDEALFRLALLSLKPDRENGVSRRGRQLLHRLKKEYPASPWTAQAAPLIELIKVMDELSSQNKDLKATKDSLSREVNELNHNIEQMKHLDVELEKSR